MDAVELAFADLDQRDPVPERKQHAPVDDAHIVISPHRRAVHPFLDVEPRRLPGAAAVQPAAERAQHQQLRVDRLRLVVAHPEVGRQVADLIAVVIGQRGQERVALAGQRDLGDAGRKRRLHGLAREPGGGPDGADRALGVGVRRFDRRCPAGVAADQARMPQLGAVRRGRGDRLCGVAPALTGMRRDDQSPRQFQRGFGVGRQRRLGLAAREAHPADVDRTGDGQSGRHVEQAPRQRGFGSRSTAHRDAGLTQAGAAEGQRARAGQHAPRTDAFELLGQQDPGPPGQDLERRLPRPGAARHLHRELLRCVQQTRHGVVGLEAARPLEHHPRLASRAGAHRRRVDVVVAGRLRRGLALRRGGLVGVAVAGARRGCLVEHLLGDRLRGVVQHQISRCRTAALHPRWRAGHDRQVDQLHPQGQQIVGPHDRPAGPGGVEQVADRIGPEKHAGGKPRGRLDQRGGSRCTHGDPIADRNTAPLAPFASPGRCGHGVSLVVVCAEAER